MYDFTFEVNYYRFTSILIFTKLTVKVQVSWVQANGTSEQRQLHVMTTKSRGTLDTLKSVFPQRMVDRTAIITMYTDA